MGQTELAEALGITTSSVTSLIDRMESAGLVRRQPHPRDRRRTVVQLTKYGTETIERTRVWFVRAFDHTADGELDAVAETLNRIATDLRAATDDHPRSLAPLGGQTPRLPLRRAHGRRSPNQHPASPESAAAILEGSASFTSSPELAPAD